MRATHQSERKKKENPPKVLFVFRVSISEEEKREKRKEGTELFLYRRKRGFLVTFTSPIIRIIYCTLLYTTLHSSSWLRRRHKNSSPRTTASTVRTRKRGLFFFPFCNEPRYNFILLNMYNTFTHPIRRALLSLFFNDKNETGVTLYHNWVTYYGPKGIMPYFLKTEGPVALVRSRW